MVREVDDALGPVGFTPDGSTIVSYRYSSQNRTQLLLIDADTLATLDEEELTTASGDPLTPEYFVTPAGTGW